MSINWTSTWLTSYSPLQYIRHKWDFCLFFLAVLCRILITCSMLVRLVWKLVSPVGLVNAKGMCDSEFENINHFEASPERLSNIWTRPSMEGLGGNLNVWIYYSVLLGTVSRGWNSQFFHMGPVFCHWRQSFTSMGALLHPLLYMLEPFLNYIKNLEFRYPLILRAYHNF